MASYLIVAVLLLRCCFKKVSSSFKCILCLLVGVRVLIPVTVSTPFGLVPQVEVSSVQGTEELQQAKGDFKSSAFVQSITGVDNVCERSAVLGGGVLYQKKFIGDGVTMALALRPFQPDWRWQDA